MDREQLPSNVVPEHYYIFIRPDPRFFTSSDLLLQFDGSAVIKIRVVEATSEVTLNAVELQLHHALVDAEESAAIILNEMMPIGMP